MKERKKNEKKKEKKKKWKKESEKRKKKERRKGNTCKHIPPPPPPVPARPPPPAPATNSTETRAHLLGSVTTPVCSLCGRQFSRVLAVSRQDVLRVITIAVYMMVGTKQGMKMNNYGYNT